MGFVFSWTEKKIRQIDFTKQLFVECYKMIGFWTSRPWWFNLQLVLSSNCPILVKEFQAQDLPRPQCSNSRLSVPLRFYVKSILIMIFKFFFRLWNVDFGIWFHVNLSGRKILKFPHCVTPFSNTTTPKKQSRIVLHQKHLFILEIVDLIKSLLGFHSFFYLFSFKNGVLLASNFDNFRAKMRENYGDHPGVEN